MYEIEINSQDNKAVLHLTGDLSIQNAESIKAAFEDLLSRHSNIEINQVKADYYDLSYLQLLIALKNSTKANGKNLSLIVNDTNTFLKTLTDSGYNETQWISTKANSNTVGGNNG